MAEIIIENLCEVFGQYKAVNNLNLQIRDKELMVLLGPSGCGKTTTLNCIAGLERPTSGKIYFDGEDITELPPHARNIAMVFQSSLVYPHLTGRRNIEMSLRKSGLPNAEVNSRISKVAKLLHIENLMNKVPSEMSGGERQRIATAKAIVRDPAVFLLDEPLSSLDAALREILRVELVNIQKTLGVTMVFVTHDQVEAMTMGDRIAVMKNGTLQQVGAPEEVYNSPANLFIAGFIGSPPMNFIEGNLVLHDERFNFHAGELKVALTGSVYQNLKDYVGRKVILGVRPQYIELRSETRQGFLAVKVFGIERLGKELIIIVEHGEKRKRFKAITSPHMKIAVGDMLHMAPLADQVYLFDPETEKTIL